MNGVACRYTRGLYTADLAARLGSKKVITLTTDRVFVGVEVGNLRPYYDAVGYAGKSKDPHPAEADAARLLPRGGWGLPLCFDDSIPPCAGTGAACAVGVNCINEASLAASNIVNERGMALARTRPAEWGRYTRGATQRQREG